MIILSRKTAFAGLRSSFGSKGGGPVRQLPSLAGGKFFGAATATYLPAGLLLNHGPTLGPCPS